MINLDGTLDRNTLTALWKAIDSANTGTVELQELHNMLASRFGKDKSSKPTGILEKVKAKILERSSGSGGIKGLTK